MSSGRGGNRSWRDEEEESSNSSNFARKMVVAGGAATGVAFLAWGISKLMSAPKETEPHIAAPSNSSTVPVRWGNPPRGFYKLNFDGSARHQKNLAGAGCIIRDYRGFPVIAAAYRLDDCENVFFAEAEALRKGLELAKSLDIEDLYIEGDSTEVINRVKGAIHVKNPSKDAKIGVIKQELEQSFNFRKIELVNRDANKVADALANIASDGKSWIPKDGRIWNKQDFPGSFPDRVLSCVKEDIDGTNLSLMWY